jgi:protein TonB
LQRLRLPVALLISCVLSVGLFTLLHTLIGKSGAVDLVAPPPKIEFVRLRRDTEVEQKVRVKPQIAKPEAPPDAVEVAASQKQSVMPGADLASLAPQVEFSAFGDGAAGGGGGFGASQLAMAGGVDRDAVPQVRIQPDYPVGARQRGIEGWVDVQFTVGTDGSVRDPMVLAAEPPQIFDRAALQAIKGWKYNPKIEDGKPVERHDLRVRIRFELES